MDVKVSKSSFGQSAKILAKTLEVKYGPLGRGGLAWSREVLAKALKFDSAHELGKFLERPGSDEGQFAQAPSPAQSMPPPGRSFFGSLPDDECFHALKNVKEARTDSEGRMWADRAEVLLEVALSATPAMPAETYLARLETGLDLDLIVEAWKRWDEGEKKQSVGAYLSSLPGFEASASKQGETARDQHGYLRMQVMNTLASARALEAFGGTLIAPSHVFKEMGRWIHNPEERFENLRRMYEVDLDGTWFFDQRVIRVVFGAWLRESKAKGDFAPMSAWSFLMHALRSPIQSERESSIKALLDLAAMPKAHLRDMQRTLVDADAELAAKDASRKLMND